MKHHAALVLAMLLAACSTTSAPPAQTSSPPSESTAGSVPTGSAPAGSAPADADSRASRTGQQFGQAVTTPLSDLNVVRAEIPLPLMNALKAPYAAPADLGCVSIAKEVEALDAVLGADLDMPSTASNPSLLERGSGAANTAAMGALRGAAEGVVPFRSWVRRLSGAERYSREVSAAIAAGGVRRSFLKGLGQAGGCSTPAAPRR